jgi:hypothetical protein
MLPPGSVPPSALPPAAPGAPGAPAPSGTRERTLRRLGVAGLALLAAAGIAIAVVLLSGGESFRDGLERGLAGVSRENARITQEFRALEPGAPDERVAAAVAGARVPLEDINRDLARLRPSPAETPALTAAMTAVAAESRWLADVQRDGVRGDDTRRTLERINGQLAALDPPVTPIDVAAVVE